MTTAEIISEIQALPFPEQSRIYHALKEIVSNALPSASEIELIRAAHALRHDYETDSELTAFTALDGEDFHAAR